MSDYNDSEGEKDYDDAPDLNEVDSQEANLSEEVKTQKNNFLIEQRARWSTERRSPNLDGDGRQLQR